MPQIKFYSNYWWRTTHLYLVRLSPFQDFLLLISLGFYAPDIFGATTCSAARTNSRLVSHGPASFNLFDSRFLCWFGMNCTTVLPLVKSFWCFMSQKWLWMTWCSITSYDTTSYMELYEMDDRLVNVGGWT